MKPIISVVDSSGQPITGDAANLTLDVITDGVAEAYAGGITEVATGRYALEVEEAGLLQSVSGETSTEGGVVIPASWRNEPSAGTGVHEVSLYVQDGDGNPIAGAVVTVPTAGSLSTAAGTGKVTPNFHLDAATYAGVQVRSSAAYTGGTYTVVVNSSGVVTSPAGGILVVTATAIPPPGDPAVCRIFEDLRDTAGVLLGLGEGRVLVTERERPQWAGDDADEGYLTLKQVGDEVSVENGFTNGSGRAYADVIHGVRVTIRVVTPEDEREFTVTAPEEETARLSSLVSQALWGS